VKGESVDAIEDIDLRKLSEYQQSARGVDVASAS